MYLVCLLLVDQKKDLLSNIELNLWFLPIECNIFLKETLAGSSSPFLNESTSNLLIFLNAGSIRWSKLLFFWLCCYFRSIFVLLNPCFIFYKKNDIIINGHRNNYEITFSASNHKFTPVTLLFCSVNRQSFVHDKWSSISQLTNEKSKDLQKVLGYMIEIVAATCKVGTGGWFASPSFPGFSVVCRLYNNSINFLMS